MEKIEGMDGMMEGKLILSFEKGLRRLKRQLDLEIYPSSRPELGETGAFGDCKSSVGCCDSRL